MTKSRVLIFSLASLNSIGGAEVAVHELVTRLSDRFEFEVISADVKSFWSKYFYPFWAFQKAKRKHQARKYDLVWAVMANQAGMAGSRFKKRFPDVPFLLTLQEGDDLTSFAYRLRLLGPKFFQVFQRADHIQAISNYLAQWARAMGATCPITVIPNGVDLENIEKIERNASEKIIITTSRLVAKNGIFELISSLAFLSDDVKLWIVGDGPQKMALESHAWDFGKLHRAVSMASRVSFLGQVESKKVSSYLGRSTIFARPARSEGLGNSFLEAMAAGLPVIGTPVGGIPDFLKEGETGWFCRVRDPESIAEKVKFILDPANREKVEQVINNARKMVEANYNWKKIAVKFGELFEQML